MSRWTGRTWGRRCTATARVADRRPKPREGSQREALPDDGRQQPEERAVKYEDLPEGVRRSMGLGHILAEHSVVTPASGVTEAHLTTVQIAAAHDERGHSVYFCNDVCHDFCAQDSVRLVMVEWPKQEAEVLAATGTAAVEVGVDALRGRLDGFRAWTFERFRHAVHNDRPTLQRLHAGSLFFLETGLEPKADQGLFDVFAAFLVDAVVNDEEEMPEWSPDCGV